MSKRKRRVAILGASGLVGQMCLRLLENHPTLEVGEVAASPRSVGQPCGLDRVYVAATPDQIDSDIIISCLAPHAAQEVEPPFIAQGRLVISHASHHRMWPQVPLVIPEVNLDHVSTHLIAYPNCCVAALALFLKPLAVHFGVSSVHVVTLQSVSGAGLPGPSAFDMLGTTGAIPGEEEKIAQEVPKILGTVDEPYPMQVSAQTIRVPIRVGHLLYVSFRLQHKASKEAIEEVLCQFSDQNPLKNLPSSPPKLFEICAQAPRPTPDLERVDGMTVTVGDLRPCKVLDFKCVLLTHNLIRGAAGGSLLLAEALSMKYKQ